MCKLYIQLIQQGFHVKRGKGGKMVDREKIEQKGF